MHLIFFNFLCDLLFNEEVYKYILWAIDNKKTVVRKFNTLFRKSCCYVLFEIVIVCDQSDHSYISSHSKALPVHRSIN